jgi:hypothetical protein
MTTIDITPEVSTALRPVTIDLYRDIHKGIRSELFATTEEAGRIDPSDPVARQALRDHIAAVVDLLVTHAEHEDGHVQPAIEQHLPALAEQVEHDHETLEARILGLRDQADDVAAREAGAGAARFPMHQLYVELASFTGAYLAHQDLEERVIMPALEAAIGIDASLEIHQAIVASIPPDVMAQSLAVMLPAMNVDDRAELLGGMQAGAPPEVFRGVWSLAGSVLHPTDLESLATRLNM